MYLDSHSSKEILRNLFLLREMTTRYIASKMLWFRCNNAKAIPEALETCAVKMACILWSHMLPPDTSDMSELPTTSLYGTLIFCPFSGRRSRDFRSLLCWRTRTINRANSRADNAIIVPSKLPGIVNARIRRNGDTEDLKIKALGDSST